MNTKDDLNMKIQAAESRRNAALAEVAKLKKQIDVITDEIVCENELIKTYQQELSWLEYQHEFS